MQQLHTLLIFVSLCFYNTNLLLSQNVAPADQTDKILKELNLSVEKGDFEYTTKYANKFIEQLKSNRSYFLLDNQLVLPSVYYTAGCAYYHAAKYDSSVIYLHHAIENNSIVHSKDFTSDVILYLGLSYKELELYQSESEIYEWGLHENLIEHNDTLYFQELLKIASERADSNSNENQHNNILNWSLFQSHQKKFTSSKQLKQSQQVKIKQLKKSYSRKLNDYLTIIFLLGLVIFGFLFYFFRTKQKKPSVPKKDVEHKPIELKSNLFVRPEDICYFERRKIDNYIHVYYRQGMKVLQFSLESSVKRFHERLPPNLFAQCRANIVVNLSEIQGTNPLKGSNPIKVTLKLMEIENDVSEEEPVPKVIEVTKSFYPDFKAAYKKHVGKI